MPRSVRNERRSSGNEAPKAISRRARSTARRERVRDEAARIFAERGYHATSMQEIANALGFTKAAMYYYYKSKEELLFDILTFADERALSVLAEEEGRQDDSLTHVARTVAAHVSWYLSHPNIAKVAFRDWRELTGRALKIQIARRRHYAHILRDSIDRCRREGLIGAEVDIGLIANFINGAVAAANVWYDPKGKQSPESVARAFGDMAKAVVLGMNQAANLEATKGGPQERKKNPA